MNSSLALRDISVSPGHVTSDCANVSGRGALGVQHGNPSDNCFPHLWLKFQPATHCGGYHFALFLFGPRCIHPYSFFCPHCLFFGPRRWLSSAFPHPPPPLPPHSR